MEMVKACHKIGIEVILEVVYTQTAEKGDVEPETLSFRGNDNSSYYILGENDEVVAAETENLFNCNHPIAQNMILDSLRQWVNEYIDGFLFLHSSSLMRGPHGKF
jgi:isoamylase